MKKLSLFMMFLALLFGAGCEGPAGEEGLPGPTGPVGPVGPVGPAGPAGASSRAASFVIEQDLAAPNYLIAFAYSDLVDFPIEVGLDDVMLVYRARILGEAANPILAWFPLPETFNLAQGGTLGYTYAALEFGEDPGLLIALSASETTITGLTANQRLQYLDGQVFKIVIIPSDLLNGKKTIPGVDFNNHDAVVKYLGLDDKKTRRVKIKK